ncbi:MAG TPA: DUF4252 domain-containing protein [Blastocatellia bacterium]|nr:DUF4252 domain-containing protein [Blastocatellia bacterium]
MKRFSITLPAAGAWCLLLLVGLGAAPAAHGQGAKLRIDQLDRLGEKAAEAVEVTLDQGMLQIAAKALSSTRSPDEAKIKELIQGLKGVYVRVFEFDGPGGYTAEDVELIRAQLRAPGWTKIVGVRSRREGDNVDVYTMLEGGNVAGLAIIAAEPRELTVVNIVGPIDLEKLSELEGKFGIPHLGLERGGRPRKE